MVKMARIPYPPGYAKQTTERIAGLIVGRTTAEFGNYDELGYALSTCPTGAHLEIGVLHGASAILAAIIRPEAHLHLVDPLDGYYAAYPRKGARVKGADVDPKTKVPVTEEVVRSNLAWTSY